MKKKSTDANLHADDANRLVGLAVQDATLLLCEVLGEQEHLVLLTEAPEMNLWLIVLRHRHVRGVAFCVTDGPVNSIKEYHEFDALDKAHSLYREVRAAGSWTFWREEQKVSA